ncbi:MAG: site-2 protease family protein [Desulfovibrio sp.]|jgi:Zn-dependent protease|nr:site-2 protease family protein [Desulfovibrio sp.]
MLESLPDTLHVLSIVLVPALLGIILHEVAHGFVAYRKGDPTAAAMGRLTLNPLPHVDPMGLLVFILTSLSSSFIFGWAKPVPVDVRYFRDPFKDMMQVALAGPLTNALLATLCAALMRLQLWLLPPAEWADAGAYAFALSSLYAGVSVNMGLCWVNMLPIPPLDGSKVLAYFLPAGMRMGYLGMERYGLVILVLLLFCGLLGDILMPLVLGGRHALLDVFGLTAYGLE